MNSQDNEKIIKEFYKKYIDQEVNRPEIDREKKEFIKNHFQSEAPFFLFRPAVMAGALSFAGVILLLFVFPHKLNYHAETQVANNKVEKLIDSIKPAPVLSPVPLGPLPLVQVKEATSEVGPVMVYQKMYKDSPVTVVWVFTGA